MDQVKYVFRKLSDMVWPIKIEDITSTFTGSIVECFVSNNTYRKAYLGHGQTL